MPLCRPHRLLLRSARHAISRLAGEIRVAPRLRDQSRVAVPTTPQTVERLRGHPTCGTLTARAISSHIDYLAEEKLRIGAPGLREPGRSERRNGKREEIVGLALRLGLVREEHLPARWEQR